MGPKPIGDVFSVGVFLRDPSPYLREFSEKTTENSERLGREARPRYELGSRLPVLSITTPPLVGATLSEIKVSGETDLLDLWKIRVFLYHINSES